MLADMATDDRAGVDERYTTAINAKTLEVAAHHSGPVDMIAAAAWSESRIGALLLRLHSEFDGGQRARHAVRSDGTVPADTKLLAIRLKSMRTARYQITLRAEQWNMESPQDKAQAVINWWLDKNCPTCAGRRWRVVKGTPKLSGDLCPPPAKGGCGGTGELRIPHGAEGRRLANFMDDCLSRARDSIKQRLRGLSR